MILFIRNYFGAIIGFILLFFYISLASNLINYPTNLAIFLLLMLGPAAIFGMVSIYRFLCREKDYLIAELGKVFGIVAFSIWVCVMCIQQGSRIYFKEYLYADAVQADLEIYKMVYQGVNTVQFTMDIAFDIFYCLLIILYSILMIKDRFFGKLIGIYGLLTGTGLLVLNLWTFPLPPAESGLIDLGPFTGIYWVIVIILFIRGEKIQRKAV